jgi:hypothetical protein
MVEAVGFSIFQRCQSIWLVTRREVECLRCETVFKLRENGTWSLQAASQICLNPGCGWQTTTEQWHASLQQRVLLGSAALQAMEICLHDYPQAKTPRECMFCIDQLIQTFHISLRTGKVSSSFGNNLIEGPHEKVVELLERLFTKEEGVNKDQWRVEIDGMYSRRRGGT